MSRHEMRMFQKLRGQQPRPPSGEGDNSRPQRHDADLMGGAVAGSSPADHLLERKLLNDLHRNPPPAAKASRSRIASASPALPSKDNKESDQELMSSMMRRLAAAERDLKLKSQQLLRVKGERDSMRDRVEELEQDLRERNEQLQEANALARLPEEEPANAAEIIAHLRTENLRLRQQNDRAWNEVGHLKEFLSDYGLVWVGDKEGEPAEEPVSHSPKGSEDKLVPAHDPAWQQYNGPTGLYGEDEWRVPEAAAPRKEPEPVRLSQERGSGSLPFEMEDLEKAIRELNGLAGDGCFDIVRGSAGEAQLRAPDAVYMVVYADGICLHTHKFCKFEEKVCQSLLQDIFDGYFPAALKHEFPDGVPLRVVDKSRQNYPMGFRPFQGQGQVLVSSSKPNPTGGYTLGGGRRGGNGAHQPGRVIRGMDDIKRGGPSGPQGAQQFLDKLPEVVIKNGKVIPIQAEVAALLKPPRSEYEMAFVNTPVDDLLNTAQRNHAGPRLPSLSPTGESSTAGRSAMQHTGLAEQITTLQVKREDGGQVYIIKLRFSNTIKDLRDALDAHRSKDRDFRSVEYEIRTAFPSMVYSDPYVSLEAAGLVPNATMFLRAV